jgi:hypothetical protein
MRSLPKQKVTVFEVPRTMMFTSINSEQRAIDATNLELQIEETKALAEKYRSMIPPEDQLADLINEKKK